MKFLDLPDEFSTNDSHFHIIPISYESAVTFGKGASKGAAAIVDASKHMEYYDEEFCVEPFEDGIYTHELITATEFEDLHKKVTATSLPAESFPCFIGGDHAVTIATVKAMEQQYNDFGVLVFDAHSDLRDSWNGSQNNHACVSKRILASHKVGIVGVRAMDVDEDTFAQSSEDVSILKMSDVTLESFKELLANLPSKLYVSIDVDCFDPSFIRLTGTPEPGGFMWRELMELVGETFATKEIIGCDVVEFAPNGELTDGEAYCLARLIYKLLALKKISESKHI